MKYQELVRWCTCVYVLLLVSGCASYYQITDQVSKKVYYTRDYDRRASGAVEFKDEKSRATVTLQSSEITEVSRQQYEAETGR
jgi:hypothetical protein